MKCVDAALDSICEHVRKGNKVDPSMAVTWTTYQAHGKTG